MAHIYLLGFQRPPPPQMGWGARMCDRIVRGKREVDIMLSSISRERQRTAKGDVSLNLSIW